MKANYFFLPKTLLFFIFIASCTQTQMPSPYQVEEKKDGAFARDDNGRIQLINTSIQGPAINGNSETPGVINLDPSYTAPEPSATVGGAPEGNDCGLEIRLQENNTGCTSITMTVRVVNGINVVDHVITLNNTTDWHSIPVSDPNGTGVNIYFDIPNSCGGDIVFDTRSSDAKWQVHFFYLGIQASWPFALGLWNHHWPKSSSVSIASSLYICDPWCSWTVRHHNTSSFGSSAVRYNLKPFDEISTGYANFWIDFAVASGDGTFPFDPVAPNVTYKIETMELFSDVSPHTDFWVFQSATGPQAVFSKDVPPTSFTGPIPSDNNCDPIFKLCSEIEPSIEPCYSEEASCLVRRGKFGLNVCEPEGMPLSTWALNFGYTIQDVTWSLSGGAATWDCNCTQSGSKSGSSFSPWLHGCQNNWMTITATALLTDPYGHNVTTSASLNYYVPVCD